MKSTAKDAKRAGTGAEPGGRPLSGAARGYAGQAALPRAAGFWLVAGVLFLLLFVSGAASPLYGVYQAQWRFSSTTLTAVFGVYALVLLVTLLVFGSVSDYLGRRRVISVAMAAGACACGLFLAAHGVGLLFAARALSGASAGTATSAGGAALIDLQPEGSGRAPVVTSAATLLGLAAGALGTGALVQYGPGAHPPGLVAAARRVRRRRRGRAGDPGDRGPAARRPGRAAATGGRAAPGTHDVRGGPAVPDRGARASRFLPGPGPVAGRAGARLAGPVVGRPGDLPGRRVRAAASVALRGVGGAAAMLAGCLVLLAGVVMTLAAIQTASAAAFLAGAAVAGAGFGPGFFLGAYRILTPLAVRPARQPDCRPLDRLLPGVQRPRRDRRRGHHARRSAPDRRGLLRCSGRARRRGRGQLPAPQAPAPRKALSVAAAQEQSRPWMTCWISYSKRSPAP